MQWVPLPLAAVDAGGLRGAQMHCVVMWWAPILAVTVGTKAAIGEGHDRLCYLEKTSSPGAASLQQALRSSSSGGDLL